MSDFASPEGVEGLVKRFNSAHAHVAYDPKEPAGKTIAALFEATAEDQVEIRAFAKTRRTLDDIPLAELLGDDRRILLQHAVLVVSIDGDEGAREKRLLSDLCDKLSIPKQEGEALVEAQSAQTQRFLDL